MSARGASSRRARGGTVRTCSIASRWSSIACLGVPGFNDIMFRGGVAWDIFGNGKTALKANAGQYVQSANNQDRYTVGNPANSFAQTTNRNWTDGNRNYVPDCDLMNPARAGPSFGRDLCSQWLTPNFGSVPSVSTINPAILEGWGVRPSDKQYSVAIQHEIVPRVSANSATTGGRSRASPLPIIARVGPADYDYSPSRRRRSRLPGGGGYPVTYRSWTQDVASDNYVTFAFDYGRPVSGPGTASTST